MNSHLSRGPVPEHLYRGQLVSYPGAWSFYLPRSSITLVSDAELEALANPDRQINMSHTTEVRMASLREVCARAEAAGHRTLIIAFDQFFAQYRPGQPGSRRYMPDSDEYIRRIADISRFAQQYGLGLELSLLTPLEVGAAYRAATGESGQWVHYRKGLRDPKTGAYSVQLWRHEQWVNNKGPFRLEDAGVRAFAFREQPIGWTPYRVVDPADIVELADPAQVEGFDNSRIDSGPTSLHLQRVRIFGRGGSDRDDLDRVLVVQQYRTPEMDYFSDRAKPFLKDLVNRYLDAGIRLHGLYSDEMHIQQDWHYGDHHDHGQFALRYLTGNLAAKFAARYGPQYRDFARYLVYFCQGQEDFANTVSSPREDVAHVWGATPEAIAETALFRSRYYRFLHETVVDLFVSAKRHAEQRLGYQLASRYHATWAESPTIDFWRGQAPTRHVRRNYNALKYDYSPTFLWSNTVHQAASACDDYFQWGEFLLGTGNDHAECGWLDRNYVGLALACSTGILNQVPNSYAAHWGMPHAIARRRQALANTFGTGPAASFGLVQGMAHRDVDVLMLYPLDLVAANERFGTWMAQYAYANTVPQAQLIARGKVAGGKIHLAGRTFSTLVATFEPFPSEHLLGLMEKLVKTGGRVVWSGPPPLRTAENTPALPRWQKLFGVVYEPAPTGVFGPGQYIAFEGPLARVPAQLIPTDVMVDHYYPVDPAKGTQVVARTRGVTVGTHRPSARGVAVYLGFRPRDDQSCSLGYEVRTWFEILNALGAYRPTGRFKGVNDNPEYLSRTAGYMFCRFPNGAVAVAPHLTEVEECWDGGFARDAKSDEEILKHCPLPSDSITLRNAKINGHAVTYSGTDAMAFRLNSRGGLAAFSGQNCRQITLDGRRFTFAVRPVAQLAFGPVDANRQTGANVLMQIFVEGQGAIRIPADTLPADVELIAEANTPGSRGQPVASRRTGATLVFDATPECQKRWIYVLPLG